MLNFVLTHWSEIFFCALFATIVAVTARRVYVYRRDEKRKRQYGYSVRRVYKMLPLARQGKDTFWTRHYTAIVLDVEKKSYSWGKESRVHLVNKYDKPFSAIEIGWRYLFNRLQFVEDENLLVRGGIITHCVRSLSERIQALEEANQRKVARLKEAADKVAADGGPSLHCQSPTVTANTPPRLDRLPEKIITYRNKVRD